VRQWVLHSIERYGKAEVESWYWELWNEPDISYWKGTLEEYDKLYDVTAAAVKKALPSAKVGGPGTTGPGNPRAANYLKQFLVHSARNETPLDFITYHAKGQPRVVGGSTPPSPGGRGPQSAGPGSHVQMGLSKMLIDVERGMQIINEFPQYAKLPIVLSEAD